MCPMYFVTKGARAVCSLPILALYEFHKRTNVALYFADDNDLLDWLLFYAVHIHIKYLSDCLLLRHSSRFKVCTLMLQH